MHVQRRRPASTVNGLRAGLQDEEVARKAVLGPLEVHEGPHPAPLAVVVLDGHGPSRQPKHVFVCGGEGLSLTFCGRHVLDEAVARCVVDELELLRAEPLSDQGVIALPESLLVDVEAIGNDAPLHYVLAQPPGGGYEHDVGEPRLGVEREDHARGGEVRADHFLHPDREGHLGVVETHVLAVAYGARGEEARG